MERLKVRDRGGLGRYGSCQKKTCVFVVGVGGGSGEVEEGVDHLESHNVENSVM